MCTLVILINLARSAHISVPNDDGQLGASFSTGLRRVVLVLTPMSHSANVLYIIMKINPRKHAHIPDLVICVLARVLACVRRACVHVHGYVEGRW